MRVGELARRTGVGVSALRAWEHRFGFLAPERSPAGHRVYAEADVERVEAVLRLVGEGLTLPAAITRVGSIGTGALLDGEAEALLYGQILEVADQGIWVSKDGRTRYVNRRMAAIMRCSVEELIAIPVLDFFDASELPAVRERLVHVRAGERLHFATELHRTDGTTFLAEITSTPLLNPAGRYDGAVSLVNDVTASNDELNETRLRAKLLDSIGEAVAAATPDGKLVYVNSAAERLFGWRAADVIGRDGRELIAAPDASDEAARIHSALVSGKRYGGKLKLTRADGTQFHAHLTSEPAHDEHGTLIGLVAVISDQTHRATLDGDARARGLQAETLALFGSQALQQRGDVRVASSLVVTEVVETTRRLLHADHASVLDVMVSTNELQVRTSSPPISETIVVPAGSRSFSGYITLARKVVIVENTHHDRRFDSFGTPAEPPTVSAIGAPIYGPDGIVGVLTADSSAPNRFNLGDAHFIQGMANVIGTALLK